MFEKHNRFYADWYDRRGVRRRKAFNSSAEAEVFEAEQKAKAHPKKKGTGGQFRLSSVPKSKRRGDKGNTRQKHSSRSRAASPRKASTRKMSGRRAA